MVVFLGAVGVAESLLAAIASQAIDVEFMAQMLVLPIATVYQFNSLCSINVVIVVVRMEQSTQARFPLLGCVAPVVSIRANASIQLRVRTIPFPDDDLVVIDNVFDRCYSIILKFLSRAEKIPRFL